jgi:molecular chaperone Hsp33
MLVVDSAAPDMCAPARLDAARVAGTMEASKATAGALLGRSHLMTIDQGADTSRYQGLVAPTVAALTPRTNTSKSSSRSRRGCGLRSARRCHGLGPPLAGRRHAAAVPALRRAGARAQPPGALPEARPTLRSRRTMPGSRAARDRDCRGPELLDPSLSSERLVYRLFHERGVRVQERADRGAMLVLARRRRGDAAELLAG